MSIAREAERNPRLQSVDGTSEVAEGGAASSRRVWSAEGTVRAGLYRQTHGTAPKDTQATASHRSVTVDLASGIGQYSSHG